MSRTNFDNFETKGLPWSAANLPETWTLTSLNPLLESLNSGFACGRDQQSKEGLIHLRPMNISPVGRVDLSDLRYVPENAGEQRLAPNDILFNNTNSIAWVGKTALIENDQIGFAFSNHMTRLRTRRELLAPAFLVRQLNWLRASGYFSVNCNKHVNQASISGDFLRNKLPIALPPLPEQRRIVARLEALDSRSRRAREKLKAVPAQLTQARQSLLAAAFRGDFTADTSNLDEWTDTTVGDVSADISYGFTASSEKHRTDTQLVRITDIQNNQVDWAAVPFVTIAEETASKFLLTRGDIIFARTGATTGKSFLIQNCPRAVFASYLIRVRAKPMVLPEFLAFFFQTPSYWQQVMESISGVAQPSCNASKLNDLKLGFPPIPEQHEIVRRLSAAFARLDAATTSHAAAVAALDRLDQSLLAQAFSGRLS